MKRKYFEVKDDNDEKIFFVKAKKIFSGDAFKQELKFAQTHLDTIGKNKNLGDIKSRLHTAISGRAKELPIHRAVLDNDMEKLRKLLIDYPADFSVKNISHPLFWACQLGSIKIVTLLLEHKADSCARNHRGELISFSAIRGDFPGILQKLKENNLQALPSNELDIMPCVIEAISSGSFRALMFLLDNYLSTKNKGILIHYIHTFYLLGIDSVSPLVDLTYFTERKDIYKYVGKIMEYATPERVEKLVRPGGPLYLWSSNVDQTDLSHLIAQLGRHDLIEPLKEGDILPNYSSLYMITPAFVAVKYGQIAYFKKLSSLFYRTDYLFHPLGHNIMTFAGTRTMLKYLHEKYPTLVYTSKQDHPSPIVFFTVQDDFNVIAWFKQWGVDFKSFLIIEIGQNVLNIVDVAIISHSWRCLDYFQKNLPELFRDRNPNTEFKEFNVEKKLTSQTLLALLYWLKQNRLHFLEQKFLPKLLDSNDPLLDVSILHFIYQAFPYLFQPSQSASARELMKSHQAYIHAFQVPGFNKGKIPSALLEYIRIYLYFLYVAPQRGYAFPKQVINQIFEYLPPENECEYVVQFALESKTHSDDFIHRMTFECYGRNHGETICKYSPQGDYTKTAREQERKDYLIDTAKNIARLLEENLLQAFLGGTRMPPNSPGINSYAEMLCEEWKARSPGSSTVTDEKQESRFSLT